jgi:predicted anti-sigma-YlaC factor YlaD
MTKKCRDIELLLSAYFENELPKEEADSVAEHLKICPECQQLKEKMEEIIFKLSDLQEEVPFFLKNRLYNILETVERKTSVVVPFFPKWLAAAVGTIILFLNLFYFTNVFPSVNREMHSMVYSIEKFVAKTGGWLEKIKESKDLIFFTFFNRKSIGIKGESKTQNVPIEKNFDSGGKNG